MSATVDQDAAAGRLARPATVRVWDPLVRVFHWSLAAAVGIAWLSGGESKSVHFIAGYAVVGLVAFRVVWGLVGTRHARFSDFIYHPATIVTFIRDTFGLRARRYVGHNPAGGAMVVLLLLGLAGAAVTGMMMISDAYWGVEWVRIAHSLIVNLLVLLVIFHLVGVVIASFEHRENLVKAMLTGHKRAPDGE